MADHKREILYGIEGRGFDPDLNIQEIDVSEKVEELLSEMDFDNAWASSQFWIEMYDRSPLCEDLAEDWREVARIIRERQAQGAKK